MGDPIAKVVFVDGKFVGDRAAKTLAKRNIGTGQLAKNRGLPLVAPGGLAAQASIGRHAPIKSGCYTLTCHDDDSQTFNAGMVHTVPCRSMQTLSKRARYVARSNQFVEI